MGFLSRKKWLHSFWTNEEDVNFPHNPNLVLVTTEKGTIEVYEKGSNTDREGRGLNFSLCPLLEHEKQIEHMTNMWHRGTLPKDLYYLLPQFKGKVGTIC